MSGEEGCERCTGLYFDSGGL